MFVVKYVKNTIPYTYVIDDLNSNVKEGTLYEQELWKTKQNVLKVVEDLKKNVTNYLWSEKLWFFFQ